MEMKYEITDRYDSLGILPPDVAAMCKGQCEGTGIYPQKNDYFDTDAERAAWQEAHNATHTLKSWVSELRRCPTWWFWKLAITGLFSGAYFRCDGWHFIKCSDCGGTGKEPLPNDPK